MHTEIEYDGSFSTCRHVQTQFWLAKRGIIKECLLNPFSVRKTTRHLKAHFLLGALSSKESVVRLPPNQPTTHLSTTESKHTLWARTVPPPHVRKFSLSAADAARRCWWLTPIKISKQSERKPAPLTALGGGSKPIQQIPMHPPHSCLFRVSLSTAPLGVTRICVFVSKLMHSALCSVASKNKYTWVMAYHVVSKNVVAKT